MKKKKKRKKNNLKNYIKNIILELINLIKKHPEFRKEYTEEILLLTRKFQINLPKEIKRKICKNCKCFYSVWKTRIKNGYIIHKCPNCGYEKWINIKQELRRLTLEKKD